MSLWIAKPTTIYYERVITFDCTDKPAIKSTVVPLGPLYPHSAYASELHFKEDLETSAQLTRAMLSLTPKTALWVAQYSLWTALIQRTWEARYLMLWTGRTLWPGRWARNNPQIIEKDRSLSTRPF